jgi:MscS family membrane protein
VTTSPLDPISRIFNSLANELANFDISILWGDEAQRIAVSVVIFGAFLLFRRFITNRVLKRIEKGTQGTRRSRREDILDALKGPVGGIPLILGILFAGRHLQLSGEFHWLHITIVRSLVVIYLFWGLHALVDPLAFIFERLRRVFSVSLVTWIVRAIKIVLILIGAATVLDLWGVRIGPILAGFGLFGVAVALGAQDLFKNLISGLLIIAEKRFNPGDWVRVDGIVEGVVEIIGFRSTLIRRFDQAPVYVPNASLSDHAVTNFSQMTYRRINWTIGLEYRTTLAQLRTIRDDIEAYLRANSDFAQPPAASMFVRIDKFSDSSIDIMVYCFTHSTVWGDWLQTKEALACEIKTIVERVGAGFAFPSQSIYVEALPD